MFSIIELKATALDYGIPGISPTHLLLFFLLMFSVPMIPYLFLFISLRGKQARASMSLRVSRESTTKPWGRMIAWVHAHRHPELLHH
jgi:hypothetical protein